VTSQEEPTSDVAEADVVSSPRPAVGRFRAWVLGVAALVVVLDQGTKWLAVAHLENRTDPVVVIGALFGDGIGPLLRLTFARNAGAAFSFGTGMTWIFALLAIGIAAVIWRVSRRLGSVWWAVALGLMLGGALGNLIDRIFRSPGSFRGHVVDFIAFPHFAVFNLADAAITCSAVLMVVLVLFGVDLTGGRTARS
jgi:signal peptidase II